MSQGKDSSSLSPLVPFTREMHLWEAWSGRVLVGAGLREKDVKRAGS